MTKSEEKKLTQKELQAKAKEERNRIKVINKTKKKFENVADRGGVAPRDEQGKFVKGHYEGMTYSVEDKKRLSDKAAMSLLRTFVERMPSLNNTLDWLETNDPARYAQTMLTIAKFAAPTFQATQIDINLDVSSSIERLLSSRMNNIMDDDEEVISSDFD